MNTIKKLVAFGCSWTFGDELEDPALVHEKENPRYWDMNTQYRLDHCYAGLIAKHYGWEHENHAFPGHSLVSIRDAVVWYVKNRDLTNTMFVVGHTESWRWSWHNNAHKTGPGDPEWNKHIHSSWLLYNKTDYTKPWQDTYRSYVDDQLCEELQINNKDQTLLLLDSLSARYNIPVIQYDMLETLPGIISVPSHVYPTENARSMIIDTGEKPRSVFASGRHPNEKGHEIIANRLIEYIDSAIIAE